MKAESNTSVEIGRGHTFRVVATTKSPDDIVEVGDEQTWVPPSASTDGKLLVPRDPKFWDDKKFQQVSTNKYAAKYSENGIGYVITLLFEQIRDFCEHDKKIWMIYGSRSPVIDDGFKDGPPNWGGQNNQ